jgi:hypothetical protein
VRSDEVLKYIDLLMKRKHQRKLSGAYEARAYKEEFQKLKEHYQRALNNEKRTKE